MQNYKNHTRYYPFHHFFLTPLTLVVFVWNIINVFQNENSLGENVLSTLLATALMLVTLLNRMYAVKNQDRTICLEERMRYLELTGKSFAEKEAKLRKSQIIALRFASNDEWLALMDKAIAENLSSKEIKLAIKNWKADFNRV